MTHTTQSPLAMSMAYGGVVEDMPAGDDVEIICGELRTGRILTTVPASDASWAMQYLDAGEVTCTLPLGSMGLQDAVEVVGYLDPARCFLAARYGDAILEAGPIWAHDYDDDTGDLTAKALGLWSLFDHRRVVKVLEAGERLQDTALAWSGLSLGTIAKRLVATAMAHAGGSLPLVLPDDQEGPHERTYPGWEVGSLGQRLTELTQVENGPDVAFVPRLTTDRLGVEWVMLTGTLTAPLLDQDGDDWVWDISVPRAPVSGLSVGRDAAQVAHRGYVTGSGTETDRPVAIAQDLTPTTAGYPLLEAIEARSSVEGQQTLDEHAAQLLERSRRPWMQWKWTARADTAPLLGDYRPGHWAALTIPTNHPYLAALGVTGTHRARILGVTGDLGPDVSIQAAPAMETR